jgi:hypothetical protein
VLLRKSASVSHEMLVSREKEERRIENKKATPGSTSAT